MTWLANIPVAFVYSQGSSCSHGAQFYLPENLEPKIGGFGGVMEINKKGFYIFFIFIS